MLSAIKEGSTAARLSERFLGNADVIALLGSMIDEGRIPHAFIIEGDDGLGKSTLARIIAEGVMCECREKLSGGCSHCRKLREDIHPDLVYVKGSGKTNSISIDTIREMRRDALIAPNEAAKRVFLLEDCDSMLQPAQNAFLKIFEEAPKHVVFIITCRSAMNLLTTIRSRGTTLTLHPVSVNDTADYIKKIDGGAFELQAYDIAVKSGGNIGIALTLLKDSEARELSDKASLISEGIMRAAAFGSELELAAECSKIGRDRALANNVCTQLIELVRQSLIVASGASDILSASPQSVVSYGMTRSADCIIKCLEALEELSASLKINISMPLFNTRLAIILYRR